MKLKITLVILTTLIIGIGIGALFHRAVIQRKIHQVLAMRNPMRLAELYHRQWASESGHSTQVQDILNRHARIVAQIRDHFSEEITSANESLWKELEPLLTDNQKLQLGQRFYGPGNLPQKGWRQPGRSFGKGIVAQRLAWLEKELQLTPGQVRDIKKILEAAQTPMMEDFTAVEQNFLRMRNRINQMIDQIDTEIENILNEEQKARYQEINLKPWIPQRPKLWPERAQPPRRRPNSSGPVRR